MKLPKIQIDPERFYRTGKYLFFTTGIVSIIRLLDMWSQFKAYDVISSISSTLFQFLLCAFFAHLQGQQEQGQQEVKELDDGDIFKMSEALDKLNLEEKDGKKK